jgi:hypothetical protein
LHSHHAGPKYRGNVELSFLDQSLVLVDPAFLLRHTQQGLEQAYETILIFCLQSFHQVGQLLATREGAFAFCPEGCILRLGSTVPHFSVETVLDERE